ncbi:hypothetical protein R6Q57_019469, partial [Mikania cordata]
MFNEIYSQKWQTSRSGQSDAMIESEAVDQFRQEFNTAFTLKRSWKIMRKFQINLNELDEEEEELDDLTRPIGRDREKVDRAKARRTSSSQPIPDYTQGMKKLSQRIGDFNKLKREHQRLVELQLLFTNTDRLTGID